MLDDIFEGLLSTTPYDFSAEFAHYVLGLKFSDEQIARYESLAARAQDGSLAADEAAELEAFVNANMLLTVLKNKARRSLIQHSPAA